MAFRSRVANQRLRNTLLIGYARVSKAEGSEPRDLHRDALTAAAVDADQSYEDERPREGRPGRFHVPAEVTRQAFPSLATFRAGFMVLPSDAKS